MVLLAGTAITEGRGGMAVLAGCTRRSTCKVVSALLFTDLAL